MQTTTEDLAPGTAPITPEGYRTTPDHDNPGWPPGVPFIVGNEACERFSFYGMRAILKIHLISLFFVTYAVWQEANKFSGGTLFATDPVSVALWPAYVSKVSDAEATSVVHLFFAGVYALPMIGALIADRYLGKYRTILYLSLVYCAGHAVLAVGDQSLTGMYVGLALIAVGSGGIKSCVSANVGDQFGKANWHKVRTIYQIFYFSINFGSFFATLLIPAIKARFGASVAFAIPGVLMFIATVVFWMGRRKFVHVPPNPGGKVGLLDTLSSVCLFMTFGHFFFTSALIQGLPTWKQFSIGGAISAAWLTAGLLLFVWRQRLKPDDGFLAITLYTLGAWFRGGGRQVPAREEVPETEPLARSRFWAPAVEKYGARAAEGPVAVFKIISVFFLISIFWALFDQKATTWVTQASQMDRKWLPFLTDSEIRPEQTIAANPFLVMLLIPLLNVFYGWCDRRGLKFTPLRRIAVGMMIAGGSFVAVALIQARINEVGAGKVSIWWQWAIPYVLLTIGEVMVSVTGLEFAYTQAPRKMKATVMGFWSLTVALGNVLVAFLAGFKTMPLVKFFWLFAGLMVAAGVLFAVRAVFYVPKDYTQE